MRRTCGTRGRCLGLVLWVIQVKGGLTGVQHPVQPTAQHRANFQAEKHTKRTTEWFCSGICAFPSDSSADAPRPGHGGGSNRRFVGRNSPSELLFEGEFDRLVADPRICHRVSSPQREPSRGDFIGRAGQRNHSVLASCGADACRPQ